MGKGQWLKQMRERFGIPQSRLAAYLTVKMGVDHNQARICEFENDEKEIPPKTQKVLNLFFRHMEQLRKSGRHWKDVFFL